MLEIIAVSLLSVLQLGDLYTTHRILRSGGIELNPVMDKLFKYFGVMSTLIVTKGLVILGAITLTMDGTLPYWATFGLSAFYAWIVYSNFKEMRKIK